MKNPSSQLISIFIWAHFLGTCGLEPWLSMDRGQDDLILLLYWYPLLLNSNELQKLTIEMKVFNYSGMVCL